MGDVFPGHAASEWQSHALDTDLFNLRTQSYHLKGGTGTIP